jgi:hypothetical protein
LFDEDGQKEAGAGLKIAGGNPVLGGQIGAVNGEKTRPFVAQSMQEIENTHRQKEDGEKNQKIGTGETPGVPADDKNGKGGNDAGKFNQDVKQKVMVEADPIKCSHQEQERKSQKNQPFP